MAPEVELTSERALQASDRGKAARFAGELLARGLFVLPHTKLYLSLAHTEADIDLTLDVMADALVAMR